MGATMRQPWATALVRGETRPVAGNVGGHMRSERSHAGLWQRSKAFGFDYLILIGYIAVMTGAVFLAGRVAPGTITALFNRRVSAHLTVFVILTLPVALYFALMEASARHATWGKRRLRLEVRRADGAPLGLARSCARTALKFVPWELSHTLIWQLRFTPDSAAALSSWGFGLVWLLIIANALSVLLNPQHKSLYDLAAGTMVIKT